MRPVSSAPMTIVDRGQVFRDEREPARRSAAFPGICVLPSGRWICSLSTAPRKSVAGRVSLLCHSDDEGATWSEPVAPFAGFSATTADGVPGTFRDAYLTALGGRRVLATIMWLDQTDPSLPLFNEATEGLLDARLFLSQSDDDGATWTAPQQLDTSPFTMPVAITGPTLLLANGDWAAQYELNKPYQDSSPWRHSSMLQLSHDAGRSWPDHVRVTDDPELRVFYWDQRPGLLADGTLLDTFWTFDRVTAEYRHIHARESRDHGRTWSALWDCGIPGQPGPPVSLPDGRIALAYMDRTAAPTLKLRTSADGGRSWPAESERILYEATIPSQTWDKRTMQDAWAEMGKFSVGLPATARTASGDLVVVYYAGLRTDETGIEWIRLR